MTTTLTALSQKSLVLIFAYAPAGLGHLRVVDALYHGLPKGIDALLLGSQDKRINALHRLFSIHPLLRRLFEWAQSGRPQAVVTYVYRFLLHRQSKLLYQQITTILDERLEVPQTVLVIATHFGLAHQLAAIKEKLKRDKKIRMILVVQITDDSPQYIWYIPGADIIFAPSERTKEQLIAYGKKSKLIPVRFDVTPYPISPVFTEKLAPHLLLDRKHQLSPDSKSIIRMAVPVSGAAVGMSFFIKTMDMLYQRSNRFHFDVIIKSTPYTGLFLNELISREYVTLHVFTHDRQVVSRYEDLYKDKVFSFEITKPSEQAFKALANPKQRGGVVLLFASPVGRQEYDNIDFLRRHYLAPNKKWQQRLWDLAHRGVPLAGEERKQVMDNAAFWRGVELPFHSINAARFIIWCFNQGVFAAMGSCTGEFCSMDVKTHEAGPYGTKEFWHRVADYVVNKDY